MLYCELGDHEGHGRGPVTGPGFFLNNSNGDGSPPRISVLLHLFICRIFLVDLAILQAVAYPWSVR
jgi:hypothetical protein